MALHKGIDVTVFTIGGETLVGILNNADYESNVATEDGASINELSEDPEPVGRSRRITGEANVDDEAAFIALIEGASPIVTFSFNSGANTYAGNGVLSQVTHRTRKRALQTETFTIMVKGTPTITAPG